MKPVLVTTVRLTGRFPAKRGGKPERHFIPAGSHLTDALIKQFDLEADGQLDRLKASGKVITRNALVVAGGDGANPEDLAAAIARAEAAEAQVAEHEATIASLTEQLEAATAPVAA